MGVPQAIIASALLSAGGSAVAQRRQQGAQKRIASQQLQQREELARKTRVASTKKVEAGRQAETTRNRLISAKGLQLQNRALANRGITGRNTGSFQGLSQNVLDEGANA
jgi:hypothetical protein